MLVNAADLPAGHGTSPRAAFSDPVSTRATNDVQPRPRPQNVGILAMDMYVPSRFVDQTDLETFDGVSTGKYTIGLGQREMSFTDDREDIHSICLTVVSSLMRRHGISEHEVGRLEVGTETIVDKSKSTKTCLMQLFPNNYDIEGVDTTNACYGGTSAVFNAVQWVESSQWDGRYAIVVAADIAVYAKGNARPTGGCGAVAMLIGPDAPLAMDLGRASYMSHVYDFYKPDLSSEYATVDGKLSINCYFNSIDKCYEGYKKKVLKDESKVVGDLDYVVFHSPFARQVQKSFARLAFSDDYRKIPEEKPEWSKDVEKKYLKLTESLFTEKTEPSLLTSRRCGNMYCASLWSGLISLLHNVKDGLVGKRVVMFSYGSGSAASMFSFTVRRSTLPVLSTLDVEGQLGSRTCTPAKDFDTIMSLRESMHHSSLPFTPQGDLEAIMKGTYYLTGIDEKWRRSYEQKL